MVNGDKINGEASPEQVSARLRDILSGGLDVHRTVAAKALARLNGKGAVDVLIKALLDEDEDVRSDASEALARIGDDRAVKQLVENLYGDPAPQVKLNAIDGLAAMGHREIIPLLCRLLKGRDDEITWDEDEYYATEWDDWTDIQLHALKALGTLRAEEAVGDITATLNHEDAHDIVEPGFKVLVNLGKAGMQALEVFLNDDDPRRRRAAAAIVGGSKSADAAASVALAFVHKDADVRYACGCALMAHAPADPRMKSLLVDANPAIRAHMAAGCLQHHSEIAEVLIKDTSMNVRIGVYQVIARHPELISSKIALEALNVDRGSGDEKLAPAAILAWGVVSTEDIRPELLEVLADETLPLEMHLAVLQAFGRDQNPEVVAAIADRLGSDKRPLRLKSMAALARLAAAQDWPNPAGDALLSALRGELISAPEEEIPEPVQQEETKPAPGVSEAEAVEPPEQAEPEVPQSTLAAILSDDPVIADVLKKKSQGPGLAPKDMEFLQLAQDRRKKNKRRRLSPDPVVAPHQDVRRFAARLLGDIGQAEVWQALDEALTDNDKEVVSIAADSLSQFSALSGDENAQLSENIIAALAHEDAATRIFLIRVLGRIGGEQAEEVLEGLTRDMDSYIVAEAVSALNVLGQGDLYLTELLAHKTPQVRLAAARMIAAREDDDIAEKLVAFSMGFDGHHRREGGRLLRKGDRNAANGYLLAILGDEARKIEWQWAIEILEEINAPAEEVLVA